MWITYGTGAPHIGDSNIPKCNSCSQRLSRFKIIAYRARMMNEDNEDNKVKNVEADGRLLS
jgi:hypothetical protein